MIFNDKVLKSIAKKLKTKKHSVAIAESVTGGLIQAAFSSADEASLFFQGGITAYNIGQKCRHLMVEPLHAMECNSVSEKIANEISLNVCRLFLSNYGIGITGYAAAIPEKNIHDVFAFYSISLTNTVIQSGRIVTNTDEGLPTQLFYANEVLKIFDEVL